MLCCKNILFNVTLTHEYCNSSVHIQWTETSVTPVHGVFIPELVSWEYIFKAAGLWTESKMESSYPLHVLWVLFMYFLRQISSQNSHGFTFERNSTKKKKFTISMGKATIFLNRKNIFWHLKFNSCLLIVFQIQRNSKVGVIRMSVGTQEDTSY